MGINLNVKESTHEEKTQNADRPIIEAMASMPNAMISYLVFSILHGMGKAPQVQITDAKVIAVVTGLLAAGLLLDSVRTFFKLKRE
ncbi:MAG: hypothetical protein QXW57_04485 [Candidatus Micrarchaeaceae archaeon]